MSRLRVVNLGLPKSGTTTLGKALKKSGLKVADWRIRRLQSTDPDVARRYLGDLMYTDYFAHGDPLYRLDDFDAFTEISVVRYGQNHWPQMDWGLLSAIIRHHPGTKFLYSHRDAAQLVESMQRWTNLGSKRLPEFGIPGLPAGYGAKTEELIRWVEGHRAFCQQVFAGNPNFLEYDIMDPEAPNQIGNFLGLDIRWWGTANPNRDYLLEPDIPMTKPKTALTEILDAEGQAS